MMLNALTFHQFQCGGVNHQKAIELSTSDELVFPGRPRDTAYLTSSLTDSKVATFDLTALWVDQLESDITSAADGQSVRREGKRQDSPIAHFEDCCFA